MEEKTFELLLALDAQSYMGYVEEPFPDGRDCNVRLLVETFKGASASERKDIHSLMTKTVRAGLNGFACRRAMLAVTRSSVDLIREGVIAVIIGTIGSDFGMETFSLSLLQDACGRIGHNYRWIFVESALSVGAGGCEVLQYFLARDEETNSLFNMGYVVTITDGQFRYVNVFSDPKLKEEW